MSEYWKSTPKYWCKHCSTYVRDTKFERQNHEATAKHQGALKRFLRDLHRNHEQEQREKERAKREVERLNGIVSSASTDHAASSSYARMPAPPQAQSTGPERQKQWEQLAEMGIDVPTELRGNMAMASEWTVTNTRIIEDAPKTDDPDVKLGNIEAIASGVRKRPMREAEDEDEEKAIRSLFKKSKKWGRDTKPAPEDDVELDALLSGTLTRPTKPEDDDNEEILKKEEDVPCIKKEGPSPGIKKEKTDEDISLSDIKSTAAGGDEIISVKREANTVDETSAVVFKKRKPKNIRQR
ncbi:hypothetical protein F4804DRAFT_343038 [Jackrogersella minutella]|nr:hypothetical protein F4804DRAFT_343038 [Jackrogersella minutella]